MLKFEGKKQKWSQQQLDLPDDLGSPVQFPSLQQTEGSVQLALGGQSRVPHLTGQCQLLVRYLTRFLGLQRTRERCLQSHLHIVE